MIRISCRLIVLCFLLIPKMAPAADTVAAEAAGASLVQTRDLPAARVLAQGFPSQPIIGGDGDDVVILWRDEQLGPWQWWMRRSSDAGRNFDEPVLLKWIPGLATPQAAGTAGRLHLCWNMFAEPGRDEVYYANIDLGSGAASKVRRLSGGNVSSSHCLILARGRQVAVMWQDVSASQTLTDMLMAYSVDGGESFQRELELGWALWALPHFALAAETSLIHAVWTTEVAPDKGVWYARIDPLARSVRKQHLLPDLGTVTLGAHAQTVVIGSGGKLLISNNSGAAFDQSVDIDPAPSPRYPGDVTGQRIGLGSVAVYVDPSLIGVVASRGMFGEVYFSASRDGGATFSPVENLSLQDFPHGQRGAANPGIISVGTKLVVAWNEFDTPDKKEYLAFRSSADQGRTFAPVRRSPILTRDGNVTSSPAVAAGGDALLFAWSEPGDARRNRTGRLMLLRVTP